MYYTHSVLLLWREPWTNICGRQRLPCTTSLLGKQLCSETRQGGWPPLVVCLVVLCLCSGMERTWPCVVNSSCTEPCSLWTPLPPGGTASNSDAKTASPGRELSAWLQPQWRQLLSLASLIFRSDTTLSLSLAQMLALLWMPNDTSPFARCYSSEWLMRN